MRDPYPAVHELRAHASRLRFTHLDPETDAELVHRWVTQPRARFWMMADHSVEDVRAVYRWIDAQPTHHAWMVRHGSQPCALFQSYAPQADPVGEVYDVLSGDLGMHLMIGPDKVPGLPRLTMAVGVAAMDLCFADRDVLRLVAEPDAGNAPAVRRLVASGFELGPVVDLPHKRAQLAFLHRARAEELFGPGE